MTTSNSASRALRRCLLLLVTSVAVTERTFAVCPSVVLPSAVLRPAVPAARATRTAPDLRLAPAEVDFGRFLVGQTLRKLVEVTNDGPAAVHLQRVETPEGLSFSLSGAGVLQVPAGPAGEVDLSIAPGETVKLGLVLATRGRAPGAWQGSATLHLEGGDTRSVTCKADLVAAPRPARTVAPSADREVSGPQPKITSTESEHHLGTLLVGEEGSHVFDFKNEGEAPLVVQSVLTTCKCTGRRLWTDTVEVPEEVLSDRQRREPVLELAVGETAHVEVKLDTRSMTPGDGSRDFEKALNILSNDPRSPSYPLRLKFRLEQRIRIEPARLTIEDLRRGETRTESLRVTGTAGDPFSIREIVPPENCPFQFAVRPVADSEVPAYDIDVIVPPTVAAGRVSANVEVEIDHPRIRGLNFTCFAQILSQVDFRGADAAARVTLLDFGVMDGTQDETRVLHIVNHDPELPYVPTNVELQAARGAEHFHQELVEIVPGIEYEIRVTVSKEMQQRYFNAFLRISSEHPDETLRVVPVKGFVGRKTPADGGGPEKIEEGNGGH